MPINYFFSHNMKKHVFVVDDDLEILEVIKILLREAGYRTTVISDSQKIFTELSRNTPDLILLDIWMAGKDGMEIAFLLKNNPETKKIPIVFVSANNEGEKLAKEAKVDDFVAKPFEINHLLKVIDRTIIKNNLI